MEKIRKFKKIYNLLYKVLIIIFVVFLAVLLASIALKIGSSTFIQVMIGIFLVSLVFILVLILIGSFIEIALLIKEKKRKFIIDISMNFVSIFIAISVGNAIRLLKTKEYDWSLVALSSILMLLVVYSIKFQKRNI